MSSILIVIPSYKRSDKLVFEKWIPKEYLKNVHLVIREEEMAEYSKYSEIVNILPLKGITGIHDKRDAICRHFSGQKIWMVDDDVTIHDTYDSEGWRKNHVETVNEKQFYEMIGEMDTLLEKYPYGVIRTKGPFRFPYDKPEVELNTWNYTNTFLNLKTITADDLGYDQVKHGEDIWAFCSVHSMGLETFCYNKFFSLSPPPKKSLDSGGMSFVRKGKLMTESHHKIVSKFPQFVKLKTPKSQLGFLDKDDEIPEMTSIRINKRKREDAGIQDFFE